MAIPSVCFINSFLYDPACKACLFEKFIFELEASYSFKITCILVRQVISLKKIGGVISKVHCLVSWSPICTALINKTTLWPLFMDGVQLPQGCSHFSEAVFFLPFNSQQFLILHFSTLAGWKAESTLEPPSDFEHRIPGLGIQRLNH